MEKFFQELLSKYNLKQEIHETLQTAYKEAHQIWEPISEITALNQLKILQAFQKNRATDFHLHGSTGYGYGDTGREVWRMYGQIYLKVKSFSTTSDSLGHPCYCLMSIWNT